MKKPERFRNINIQCIKLIKLKYFIVALCVTIVAFDSGSRPLKKMALSSVRVTLNSNTKS
jgi:hypothetical protein